jgi:hypothetical protein
MLARLVFERVTEGTVNVAGVGWVLTTPHVQHRTLVTPARPVRVETTAPEVLRIDARPEGGATPEVVAEVDGKEVTVPLQGEPLVVAAAGGSPVVVSVRSGEATVVVAQRVAAEREASAPVAESKAQAHAPPQASALSLDLAAGTWRQTAKGSPRPLTWLEDRLGTIEADTGVTAANVHEGATASGNVDAYFYEDLMYRRRVEAPNLYTFFGASARLRDGPPTLAGEAGFYEDLDRYRMRITGTATGFFILPRLGYDGYYTNLAAPPPASVTVDDDVYDPFRFVRNTIMFLQGLFWYCPHFNDIYYLRVRANFDVGNGAFSHAAVTPGVLLIFHQAELQLTATGAYYEATQPVRMSAGFEGTAYGELIWHAVVLPGSFELRPNIQTEIKLNDGSWQLSAGVNILAAARRGMRDYSSLELEFPEETAGGVPWRDESRVGP